MSLVVESALREIADRHDGKITPELVVEAAKPKDSPLHGFFTWDVKKAAHDHLLHQARMLIRSVRVEVTTTQFNVRAPVYVRDPASPGDVQGYTSLSKLRTDEDMAREVVVSEFARAAAALARARAVAAALDLAYEIDDVRTRVLGLSEKAQTVAFSSAA